MRHQIYILLALVFALMSGAAHAADDETLRPIIAQFASGDFAQTASAVEALAATGDPRVVAILDALENDHLAVRQTDQSVVILTETNFIDPLTKADLGAIEPDTYDTVAVNNKLRRAIDAAMGGLSLMNPDPAKRLEAAQAVFKSKAADQIPLLDQAIAAEKLESVKAVMLQARAAAILGATTFSQDDRIKAVLLIARLGDQSALGVLNPLTAEKSPVGDAARNAVSKINSVLAMWSIGQNMWYGFSLSSVLLLAAIGLAITFGVMGVINMAHGEMVMLGAYTTYGVQEVIRNEMPGLFDYSLLIALPLAFCVSAVVGIVIERFVIRFLYGRPLETLLATWGISLILQQLVRSIFGPDNRQVGNPSWMSGAFDFGQMQVTWSRLWIICFAILVFAGLLVVLKKTFFGLTMRAVTQNRGMASAMGIRTPVVDAMTFGLGSGIAGIAGVALSQIDNVSPNLGQGYIIDSFMVVVFGGVGNLWGTLVGALTLGIANKVMEPYFGAVLGKIALLVFIILFIQKRPRGLFALKGRSIE